MTPTDHTATSPRTATSSRTDGSARAGTSRVGLAAAAVAIAAAGSMLTGCGDDLPVPTTPCGLITDLSNSATAVTDGARSAVTALATDRGCASVQIVPITANSAGERCSTPPVSLTELTASRDNPAGIAAEIEDTIVPQMFGRIRALNDCVAAAGTGDASDVTGAFRQLDRLLPDAPDPTVLVVSDLMHNVDADLLTAPQDTPEQRTAIADAIAEQLPDLSGWDVVSAGAAADTTAIGAKRSDTVQRVWEQAVTARGGTWQREPM